MAGAVANYGTNDVQTFKAAVDMDTKTGHFAFLNSSGELVLASDGGLAIGVIVNVQSAGVGADIGVMTTPGRKVPIVASGSVAAGASIASNAAGRAKTAAAGNAISAIALQEATTEGNLITGLFGYYGAQA